jgi:hypothetical protein
MACRQAWFASLAVCMAVGTQPIPEPLLMHKHELSGPAVCGDGSPAIYYYRNCTANWDSKPGDPDFCAKGTPLGVSSVQWLLVFGGNATLACFDDATCSERASALPSAVSSAGAAESIYPDGLLAPAPEANPNFYKAHVVFVSCSELLSKHHHY